MVNKRLRFKLRTDMPRGFLQNPNFPELPAVVNFLRPYDGTEFGSIEKFREDVLCGFLDYLDRERIPAGSDTSLREGLFAEESPAPLPGRTWNYYVYAHANNGSGKCVFGGLETIEPNA